jgi:hypothetical protein
MARWHGILADVRIVVGVILLAIAAGFGVQFMLFGGIAIGRHFANSRTDYTLVMNAAATFACLSTARWCFRRTRVQVRG